MKIGSFLKLDPVGLLFSWGQDSTFGFACGDYKY